MHTFHNLCACTPAILSVCCCVYSYLSIVKQKEAATASSGQNAIIFVISGVLVLAGSAIAHALGMGWYMTILAVVHLIAASLALGQILLFKVRHRRLLQALPAHTAGPAADGGPCNGGGGGGDCNS